jgi:hypothetical protein
LGQQIEKQGAQPGLLQKTSDEGVAGTQAARSAAVGEDDHSLPICRHPEDSIESDAVEFNPYIVFHLASLILSARLPGIPVLWSKVGKTMLTVTPPPSRALIPAAIQWLQESRS